MKFDKVPKGDRTSIECDVCAEIIYHPKTTEIDDRLSRAFCNQAILGCDDVLCWWCYLQWYDGGRTDREEIKHTSRLQRYQEIVKKDTSGAAVE